MAIRRLRGVDPRLKMIWADGGYAGELLEWTRQFGGWVLEIVKRGDDVAGFAVLPNHWIVDRTLGWQGKGQAPWTPAIPLP